MTTTTTTTTMTTTMTSATATPAAGLRSAVYGRVDLYREIHKGLRRALFTVTEAAGRVDVTDDDAVVALVDETRRVTGFLARHAEHEDQPVLDALIDRCAPQMLETLRAQHATFERVLDAVAIRADEVAVGAVDERAPVAHALYLELGALTAAFLDHLDLEERVVMPALAAACDDCELGVVLGAILRALDPGDRATGMYYMLPALDPAERSVVVGRIRATAPPAAMAGVRAIASAVLPAAEVERLGLTGTAVTG